VTPAVDPAAARPVPCTHERMLVQHTVSPPRLFSALASRTLHIAIGDNHCQTGHTCCLLPRLTQLVGLTVHQLALLPAGLQDMMHSGCRLGADQSLQQRLAPASRHKAKAALAKARSQLWHQQQLLCSEACSAHLCPSSSLA
jgi:hypothetical protein